MTKGLHTNFEHVSSTAYHYHPTDGSVVFEYIATHHTEPFCELLDQSVGLHKQSQIKLPNVLQKFVYTKSSKNQMLRVQVKDCQVAKVDRAFNINDMLDPRTPLQERCCTYEVDKLIKPQSQQSLDIMRLRKDQMAGISEVPEAIATQLTLATN